MLVVDIESFPDLFLVAFLEPANGEVMSLSARSGPLSAEQREILADLMQSNTTVSFNGKDFDLPILALAMAGGTVDDVKALSNELIKTSRVSWKICKDRSIVVPETWDHIDLIDVAPGKASLKLYGARLGVEHVQDIPYDPNEPVGDDGVRVVEDYCANDLRTTWALYQALKGQVDLRIAMGKQYGGDFRSLGDAAIAEKIILNGVAALGGQTRKKKEPTESTFRLRNPGIVTFASAELSDLFARLLATEFTVNSQGRVCFPKDIEGRDIQIGGGRYRIGIGGMHSNEERRFLRSTDDSSLIDLDVASYYPSIILQQKLAPGALGVRFLSVYKSIVERRLAAKRSGDKTVAESLKIVVNASFGKLGNIYSPLFAPDLFAQVTVVGQLCLLMLIERLEAAEIRVVSANTDGVVAVCPNNLRGTLDDIVWNWQMDTSFELEETRYRLIAARDVNNYMAVTPDGKVKRKGVFAKPGLSKNPAFPIIYGAAVGYLADGTPIGDTIRGCNDIREFCAAQRVTGGTVWREQMLGKVVRFYLSTAVPQTEHIRYAKNTNRVPNSHGGRPCMAIQKDFPEDVDYARYIEMAEEILVDVGAAEPKKKVEHQADLWR